MPAVFLPSSSISGLPSPPGPLAPRRSRQCAVVGSKVPPPPRKIIIGSLCACISRRTRRAASSRSSCDAATTRREMPAAFVAVAVRAMPRLSRQTPLANSRAMCEGDARTPGGATRARDAFARATAATAAFHCVGDCRSSAAASGDTALGTCSAMDSGTPRAIQDAAVDATSDPAAMRDAAVRIMSRGRVSAKRVKGRNSRRETRGESQ